MLNFKIAAHILQIANLLKELMVLRLEVIVAFIFGHPSLKIPLNYCQYIFNHMSTYHSFCNLYTILTWTCMLKYWGIWELTEWLAPYIKVIFQVWRLGLFNKFVILGLFLWMWATWWSGLKFLLFLSVCYDQVSFCWEVWWVCVALTFTISLSLISIIITHMLLTSV